jgi:hypothetical protein
MLKHGPLQRETEQNLSTGNESFREEAEVQNLLMGLEEKLLQSFGQ